MKNMFLSMALAAVLAGASSLSAQVAPPNNIYAQKLTEEIAAKHPEVTIISLHMAPPGMTDAVIVACSDVSKVGKKSTPEHDLIVMKTGKPTGGANEGRRDAKSVFHFTYPLLDKPGAIIGGLVLEIKYSYSNDSSVAMKHGQSIADEFRAQIPSKTKLFEPTH
jgi:hypothetical protein